MRTVATTSALLSIAVIGTQALINGTINGPIVPGTTGKLGNASVVTTNPVGVTYTAILPDTPKSSIRGYVAGTTNANGTGVNFNINIYGLPDASLGPFMYHIHDQPVPSDGNCTKTLAHQDPTERGEIPPCDPSAPETCQVGDLAGKHGNITSNPFQVAYLELFASTQPGLGAFFGNRSIVIHTSNATRLTCANFSLTGGEVSGSPSGTGSPSSTSTPPPFTGGAVVKSLSFGAVFAGLAALLL
ncbi:hypothetical protein MMC16_003748 [Acarospora aff. strigata]|nr:hypothetical protein [Acarospora aff. strigata]